MRPVEVHRKTMLVDGLATSYLEAGEGDPVVLLHGGEFGASAELGWERNIAALAARCRVLAPDQLGFGQSAKVIDFVDGRGMRIRHVARFCEVLGIDRAHFVGNSMGAINLLTDATSETPLLPIRTLVIICGGGEIQQNRHFDALLVACARHFEAMLKLQQMGSITFDYGNNIRTFAFEHGVKNAYDFPGFVPEYIRPLFCEGRGPFRWAALSGEASDIARTDQLVLEMFPHDEILSRWIKLAQKRVKFQGLPARICWLGYGERDKFGLALNDLVARGELKAPIVIGRDHLDCGSVASPFRETEKMLDGSDAVADWALLNAMLNTASGASWVSIHNGGGVGIGYSQHAGQVTVADGTKEMASRIERVLTNDPGIGVARHVDAGYPEAIEFARKSGVKIPMG